MNDADLKLRQAVSRLPRSVQPEWDLWASISAEISPDAAASPQRRAAGWVWALAASVAGMAIGVAVTLAVVHEQAHVPLLIVDAPRANYAFVPASTDAVRVALRRDAIAQMKKLAPNTRAHVEADLNTISGALADIQAALAKDPGNSLLQDLLVTTYQDELNTLANVQALASTAHTEVSI